jgi:hypothetical protein
MRAAVILRPMDRGIPNPPWREPGWLERATAWIDEQLAALGIRRVGPLDARERAWSIVLVVPTDGGPVYFKETAAAFANDAALTVLLSRLAPDVVLAPLAADPDRGWMILPHGGERLRDVLAAAPDAGLWEQLLPRYANLQLAAAAHLAELRAAGAFDRRLGRLPRILRETLDDPVIRGEAGLPGLPADVAARLEAMLPAVEAACGELAEIGIPQSIQHDDFHDGNVLVGPNDGLWVIDWGDSQVGHPFASLLVALRSVADGVGLAEGGSEVARLQDAYLEPFGALASRSRLLRAVSLATRLGMLGRALAWRAVVDTGSGEERAEFAAGAIRWLEEMAAAGVD